MKTWHIVAVVVAVYLLWRWLRASSGATAGSADSGLATLPPRPIAVTDRGPGSASGVGSGPQREAAVAILKGAWGGSGDFGPLELARADQDKYPGWWRTPDGGWVNPDTGESFSPGTSPTMVSGPTREWWDEQNAIMDNAIAASLADVAARAAAAPTPTPGYVIY